MINSIDYLTVLAQVYNKTVNATLYKEWLELPVTISIADSISLSECIDIKFLNYYVPLGGILPDSCPSLDSNGLAGDKVSLTLKGLWFLHLCRKGVIQCI